MIFEVLTPFVTAVCDRIRGGYPDERVTGAPKPWWARWLGRLVKWTVYGGVLASHVTTDWRLILAAGILFNLGERPGYQGLIGQVLLGRPQTDPHSWQIGYLKKAMGLALLTRGLLWALPILPLIYFEPGFVIFAGSLSIGCLLAPYVVKYLPLPETNVFQLLNKFPWQEAMRGFLFGLLTVVFAACFRS